ncbi:MAG: ABC transporter ATP-binding protein [Clostridia bacterium]|nr:ABC transporter ATP-binding protein [Clostridia bacterium]
MDTLSMSNCKLSIQGICKQYKNNKAIALDHVSVDVMEGEFLSILGPSGCGKTTLLRIIAGLLAPDEGKLLLDGKDITTAPPSKRSLGIVFQNYALFENMTVLENVTYAAYLKAKREKSATKAEITNRAMELLSELGIADYAKKYPASLSGGQMQRVAIARTLILNPDIMLFDEPASALDVATRLQLRTVIKDIQAKFGTTMIYITHDQEEAFAMSDRIMVMETAHISQIGTPAEIVSAPANDYVKSFVVDNLQTKIESLNRALGKSV